MSFNYFFMFLLTSSEFCGIIIADIFCFIKGVFWLKVFYYFGNRDKVPGEASSHSVEAKKRNVSIPGIEFTSDPESDYDILHINTISPMSEEIVKQARKKGAAVVYQADSSVIRELESSFLPNIVSDKVSKALGNYLCNLYSKADYILTPTLHGKRLFEKCNKILQIF